MEVSEDDLTEAPNMDSSGVINVNQTLQEQTVIENVWVGKQQLNLYNCCEYPGNICQE